MYGKDFSWRKEIHKVPDLPRTVRMFAEAIGTEVDENRWGCSHNARQNIAQNNRMICAKPTWSEGHEGFPDRIIVAATGIDGFLAELDGEVVATARYLGGDMFELADGTLV